jgi:hypothetical protein
MYSEGLFRLEEPGDWRWCGSPGRRLLALGVHGGALYGPATTTRTWTARSR